MDESSARGINISDQEESNRNNEWKDQQKPSICLALPSSAFAKPAIGIIQAHPSAGMRFNQAACVYPCELSTSFMPETASATTGLGGCSYMNRGPKLSLQTRGRVLNLCQLSRIPGRVELYAFMEIFAKQRTYPIGAGGW